VEAPWKIIEGLKSNAPLTFFARYARGILLMKRGGMPFENGQENSEGGRGDQNLMTVLAKWDLVAAQRQKKKIKEKQKMKAQRKGAFGAAY